MKAAKKILVDINQGSIDDLIMLNGIGESLAKRIIDHRPFKTLDELVQVSGINKVKLASLTPFITVGRTRTKTTPKGKAPEMEVITSDKPVATLGKTEAFVFLESRNDRQDALLIIFGGFILGLLILFLRRSKQQQ